MRRSRTGQRQGGNTCDLDDALALLAGGETCTHAGVNLYLAGALCAVAEQTGFDLAAFLDQERREALTVDQEPGGLA